MESISIRVAALLFCLKREENRNFAGIQGEKGIKNSCQMVYLLIPFLFLYSYA